jgi:hypothetical protein
LGVSACALIASKAEVDAAMLEQILGPVDRMIEDMKRFKNAMTSQSIVRNE